MLCLNCETNLQLHAEQTGPLLQRPHLTDPDKVNSMTLNLSTQKHEGLSRPDGICGSRESRYLKRDAQPAKPSPAAFLSA